jgi:outer membrane lipoprotein LolB
MEALTRWDLNGRIAIETSEDGFNAVMKWAQDGDSYSIRIIAPFGQGTYELRGDGRKVIMQTAENKIFSAASPELLMQETLGWSMPVKGLQYWVRGIPDPDLPMESIDINESGHMTGLRQGDWDILVKAYREIDDLGFPVKLFMSNERLRIRLAVQQWRTD